METLRISVHAPDPLASAGLISMLEAQDGSQVVAGIDAEGVDVRVVVTDELSTDLLCVLRQAAKHERVPVVLVVTKLQEAQLLAAVECRVVAVLPRAAATSERLLHSIRAAAAGGGVLPPPLLGEVLQHVQRLQRELLVPKGMDAAGLSPREIDVLRMVADGWDTAQIAVKLCYSERTVKNVLSALTQRLKVRNRPHAVAYALRTGMI
ncbi:LuxR C-terminal-related transcriptional regulator [Lentzea sp. NPDC051213]|uniref:helix-turn-helix transcriptional regulator n=1 Tax=Lentzea sp. NPDC051213 TaxID=3364126 RepID=UPI0037B07B56